MQDCPIALADTVTHSRVDEKNQPIPLKHFSLFAFYSVGEADFRRNVALDDVFYSHGVSPVGKKLSFVLLR